MQNAENSTRIYLVVLFMVNWTWVGYWWDVFFFIYLKSRSVEISQIINLILENSYNENEATSDPVVWMRSIKKTLNRINSNQ